MYIYKNIVDGTVIETSTPVTGNRWEEISPPTAVPTKTVKKEKKDAGYNRKRTVRNNK